MAYDKITLSNQQNSPLLRLPAEIRNQICELAIGGNEIRVSHSSKNALMFLRQSKDDSRSNKIGQKNHLDVAALGQSCMQLRLETANLHLRLNTFLGEVSALGSFIRKCGANASALHTVGVYMDPIVIMDMGEVSVFGPEILRSLPRFRGLNCVILERPHVDQMVWVVEDAIDQLHPTLGGLKVVLQI